MTGCFVARTLRGPWAGNLSWEALRTAFQDAIINSNKMH